MDWPHITEPDLDRSEVRYWHLPSALHMSASGHSPKLGYASGTFGVRYHETLDCEGCASSHTNMTLSSEILGSCNPATCRDDVKTSAWMLLIAARARVLFYLGFNCSRARNLPCLLTLFCSPASRCHQQRSKTSLRKRDELTLARWWSEKT